MKRRLCPTCGVRIYGNRFRNKEHRPDAMDRHVKGSQKHARALKATTEGARHE